MMTKRRIDLDVVGMSAAARAQEIMRLRAAIRKRRDAQGNAKCWILDERLFRLLPDGIDEAEPLDLPRETFLRNCARYYDRNQRCP
jgi:hypothetical protein